MKDEYQNTISGAACWLENTQQTDSFRNHLTFEKNVDWFCWKLVNIGKTKKETHFVRIWNLVKSRNFVYFPVKKIKREEVLIVPDKRKSFENLGTFLTK